MHDQEREGGMTMDMERFRRQLDFITEVDKAKRVLRNTILLDSSRRENDAEHSWHMAVSALILKEYLDDGAIDMARVVNMALLHDIAEIDEGDLSVYDTEGRKERAGREREAARRIFGLLPEDQRDEFLGILEEFEEGQTPEARFAQLLDRFMPLLHNYLTRGVQWQRLGVTRKMVLERNRGMERASRRLWRHVVEMVDDAVAKGYLKA